MSELSLGGCFTVKPNNRSQRDHRLQIPQRQRWATPPHPSCRTGGMETERVVWWEAGGLVSNQSCKSHQPSTVSSLPAHPGDGRHTNLLRPQGTKIHIIIYFTFMSSCVMKIKSKLSQGAPGSVSLSFFLPSPSIFSSPSPLLLAFEVLIRFYWCMKVKCRLYIGDHFAAPGHAGCSQIYKSRCSRARACIRSWTYVGLSTGLKPINLDTWSQSHPQFRLPLIPKKLFILTHTS